jgi:DNA-binding MarR family transcriptional regulator
MGKLHDIAQVNDFIKTLSELTEDPTMPCQQQMLLLSLYGASEVSQSELENLTGVKRSSNSRNIAKLGKGEDAWANNGPGWVESYEDLHNRRVKMVRLTPRGRAMLDDVWNRVFSK